MSTSSTKKRRRKNPASESRGSGVAVSQKQLMREAKNFSQNRGLGYVDFYAQDETERAQKRWKEYYKYLGDNENKETELNWYGHLKKRYNKDSCVTGKKYVWIHGHYKCINEEASNVMKRRRTVDDDDRYPHRWISRKLVEEESEADDLFLNTDDSLLNIPQEDLRAFVNSGGGGGGGGGEGGGGLFANMMK